MSYQVLARKWRPKNFGELAGQEHVVRALGNALTRGRLHHAYLLTGTRGVGKTTIARILAKSLNCVQGVTATPCGVCAACTDIDAGRFVDLLELDAASNTGIDNMREILDNARYAPTVGRYKVYLIDEVHMLSKAAFNSMLKTLEEPPEHVKFVLATTDPQKIPVTVLSRCLQFSLRQLPVATIASRLGEILDAEQVVFEPGALQVLARAAQGSMRDALSLLDQAIAYGAGEVREEVVRTMLGAVDTGAAARLVDALVARDGAALLAEADAMASRGVAFGNALEDLASLFHRIAVAQTVPDAARTFDDADSVEGYARALSPEAIQLAYQICVQGRADLALAPDEATGFSMTLLRLLAFEPAFAPASAGGGEGPQAVAAGTAPSRVASSSTSAASPQMAPPVVPATRGLRPEAATETSGARSGLRRSGTVATDSSSMAIASSDAVATPPADTSANARSRDAPARAPLASPGANAPLQDASASAPLPAASVADDAPVRRREPEVASDRGDARDAGAEARPQEDRASGEPSAKVPSGATRSLPASAAEWPDFAAALAVTGLARQLAAQSEWRALDGRELVLGVAEGQRHLTDKAYADKLRLAIEQAVGGRVRLRFETVSAAEASLAAREKRERADEKAQREAQFRDEPFVRDVLARFDGRIKPDSIKPVS